jgi:hypothetical protein
MTIDSHQRARYLVEETRVAGISPHDVLWLRRHVADCAQCALYEETVEGIVGGLRSFAFECDPAMGARIRSAVIGRARKPSRVSRWALAAAATLVVTLLPVWKSVREERRKNADALLMEQVESRVRRPVPVAMEPLLQPQPETFQ